MTWHQHAWVNGLCLVTAVLLPALSTTAQTIINIPPSPSPSSAGADTVVNLLPGGILQNFFQSLNGSTLNIQGGQAYTAIGKDGSQVFMTAGDAINLVAESGSHLFISGGRITGGIEAYSLVNISGGRIDSLGGDGVITISGGAIERINPSHSLIDLQGVEFAVNGVHVAPTSQTVNLPIDSVITGTLADGRVFA
jgi:hypothetical protein